MAYSWIAEFLPQLFRPDRQDHPAGRSGGQVSNDRTDTYTVTMQQRRIHEVPDWVMVACYALAGVGMVALAVLTAL